MNFELFYSRIYKRFAVNSVDPLFFAPLLPIEAAVNRRFEEDECAYLRYALSIYTPEKTREKKHTPFYVCTYKR
jgi:hypothetical protein